MANLIYQEPMADGTVKLWYDDGTSIVVGTPGNSTATAQAWEASPYGQRYAQYEAGLATQNQFNNNIQTQTLANQKRQIDNQYKAAMASARNDAERNEITRAYNDAQVKIAEEDIAIKQGDLQLRRELGYGDLALRQGTLGLNTVQLGAQLHGPRDIFAYQRAASAVNQNPLLTGAVNAWDSLTNTKPTGLGGWQAGATPQPFDMAALTSDFGGGAGSQGNGGSPYTAEQQAFLAEADRAARDPNKLGSGWWTSKNPDQQQLYLGAWDTLGHSIPTVLSRIQATRIGQQGFGGSQAA